ncbi:hypothetical protein Sjap_016243 [Stephania japonica]|uniref:Uncharacterized protein n=1 Tax=Stephania japonica TaxID=461633 RepID=A0AAP0NUT4_9MAGN
MTIPWSWSTQDPNLVIFIDQALGKTSVATTSEDHREHDGGTNRKKKRRGDRRSGGMPENAEKLIPKSGKAALGF